MPVLYTNNATSTLAASITNAATSLSVASGAGALFPTPSGSDFFYATLADTAGNYEIVKVTARSTDTLTIVRAQDGTTARAFSAGDKIELRITKGMLDQLKLDALLASANAQSANTVLAAPNGTAGAPAFRALVAADIPTLNQNTSGSAGSFVVTAVGGNTMYLVGTPAAGSGTAQAAWAGGVTYNGSNGNLILPNGTVLHTGNASTYVLPLTGGTVSGATLFSNTTASSSFTSGAVTVSGGVGVAGNIYGGGSLVMTGNVTAYSDERLKTDWDVLADSFLERLAKVRHGTFTRIDTGDRQAGVSAQSLRTVMPEAVQQDGNGQLSVAYGNAALVAAVSLARRVVEQDARIARLEAQVARLITQ